MCFFENLTNLNFTIDDEQNVNCLNSVLTGGIGKTETWLVYMAHGFTGSLDENTFLNWTRDTTLDR